MRTKQKLQMNMKDEYTLELIRQFIEREHFPPSLDELQALLGLRSKTPVRNRLARLKALGKIDYTPNDARTIRLTEYEYILKRKTGIEPEPDMPGQTHLNPDGLNGKGDKTDNK